MPKRSNPFGDHSTLQLKTCMQGQEVVNGVSQQKNTHSAYACHNCREAMPFHAVMKCQMCENYICCHCVRQCASCHLHFCHLCFVVSYGQSTERAICFKCQGG
ncbi:unnamed protein product [Candidula unifasciata]|uniref:Apoptosis regulatory protein Siva n=1 Tax=Candidula unifasciata TaxID=100452 RepID=A0A8S3ZSN3_9EUPU|nr:unnamed protein product [Candidula unifasciata]